ncbi:hypothetical protein M770_31350 (plasmid) [Pseudomonas aeruginosa VRFPA03]|nr:hypothetical protein M770_31350 [Pseudomonas aeruginosa VRFPA03]
MDGGFVRIVGQAAGPDPDHGRSSVLAAAEMQVMVQIVDEASVYAGG